MSEVKVNKITPTTNCGTVTLGDSGDTIAIASGVTLSNSGSITNSGTITNTGTISGGTITGTIDNQVNWDTTAKTAGFTAVAGTGYFVNTTSGAITVTLPATPSAGDLVGIKDYANTANTNNITIDRNGSNIQGTANNFTISVAGTSITLIYVDGTQGWVSTGAAKASDISEQALFITATGGTITTCGDYKIHTFTSPGTFCVSVTGNGPTNPNGGPSNVDYLVVAGGGGSGLCKWGGGGGGGGFRTSSGVSSGCYTIGPLGSCVSALPVPVAPYPITVGGGGAASTTGSNSIFSTITSAGGGGGANYRAPGCSGGSGGGGGGCASGNGGAGNTPPVSPPQGQNGGPGIATIPEAGGGGGGAGATGSSASPSGGGPGGNGSYTNINSSNGTTGPVPGVRYYSGGGGGSQYPGYSGSPGSGGAGGGGSCAAGTTNTGGGGGGSTGPNGYAGGSGIVIIRYKYQ